MQMYFKRSENTIFNYVIVLLSSWNSTSEFFNYFLGSDDFEDVINVGAYCSSRIDHMYNVHAN